MATDANRLWCSDQTGVKLDAAWDQWKSLNGPWTAGAEPTGTAQAGAATTITLDPSSTWQDDEINAWEINLTGGTGSGQAKVITDYVASTKVATVISAWSTNPDATTTYQLVPCTDTDQQYGLQNSFGTIAGFSWQNLSGSALEIGNEQWNLYITLQKGGAGIRKTRCVVRHYGVGPSYTVQQTIINTDQSLSSGTVNYTISASPGSIIVEPNEWIGIQVSKPDALGTDDYVNYDNDDTASSYETWLGIPTWTEIDDVTSNPNSGYGQCRFTNRNAADPIAQWNCVPHQRIADGTTFDVGVLAFCKGGISQCEFTLTPATGTYSGSASHTFAPAETDWAWNTRTSSWEYYVTVDCANFSTNTEFDLDVVVTGTDGGVVDKDSYGGGLGLDTLKLYADKASGLTRKAAYVNTSGTCSDTSGIINVGDAKPGTAAGWYPNIEDAIDQLVAVNTTVDFCEIYLKSGQDHVFDRVDATNKPNTFGWLIITVDDGDVTDTRINGAPATQIATVQLIQMKDIKIGTTQYSLPWNGYSTAKVWFDGCNIVGTAYNAYGPLFDSLQSKVPKNMFATDCTVSDMREFHGQPSAGTKLTRGFIRGCSFSDIGEDVGFGVAFMLNCTITNLDPQATGWHADVMQFETSPAADEERPENLIMCNVKATGNCNYQGIFIKSEKSGDLDWPMRRWAFINNVMEFDGHPLKLMGNIDHLLIWHNTLIIDSAVSNPDVQNSYSQSYTGRSFLGCPSASNNVRAVEYPNLDIQGNHFDALWFRGSNYQTEPPTDGSSHGPWAWPLHLPSSYAASNNYYWPNSAAKETNSQSPGTDATTIDPKFDSSYVPRTGAMLARFSPPIPFDLNNDTRPASATIGAIEGIPGIDVLDRHYPRGALRGVKRGALL